MNVRKIICALMSTVFLFFATLDGISYAAKNPQNIRILTLYNVKEVTGGNSNIVIVERPDVIKTKTKKSKKSTAVTETEVNYREIAFGKDLKFSWADEGVENSQIPTKKHGLANMNSPIKVISKTQNVVINLGEEIAKIPQIFTRVLDENGNELAEFDFADSAIIKLEPEYKNYYIEFKAKTETLRIIEQTGGFGGFKVKGFKIPLFGAKKQEVTDFKSNDSTWRPYRYFYVLLNMKADTVNAILERR